MQGPMAVNNSRIERPYWSIFQLSFCFFVCSPSLITCTTVLLLPPLSILGLLPRCQQQCLPLHFVMQFSRDPLCYFPHSVLSLPSLLPTSLFSLIICHATRSLQDNSHWSPFLSHPVQICCATAIPLYASQWSLFAELCVTLSFSTSWLFITLPMLFDLILQLSEICLSLQRAAEVCFIFNYFISREHKWCAALGRCMRSAESVCPLFSFWGNHLVSFKRTMLLSLLQSIISFTRMHPKVYQRENEKMGPLFEIRKGICFVKYSTPVKHQV